MTSTQEPSTKRTKWTFHEPAEEMKYNNIHSNLSIQVGNSISSSTDSMDLIVISVSGGGDNDNDDEMKSNAMVMGKIVDTLSTSNDVLKRVAKDYAKSFKFGSALGVMTPCLSNYKDDGSVKRVSLLGLGKTIPDDEIEITSMAFKIGSSIVSKIINECNNIQTVAITLPSQLLSNPIFLKSISCAIYSDLYSDNRYRTGDNLKENAKDLVSITFIPSDGEASSSSSTFISQGMTLAKGVYLTKDIVNAPHNYMNSLGMANVARKIAADHPDVMTCTILGAKECEEYGMGAYLAVGRGSETPPQFCHLVYKCTSEVKQTIACVGKGVMFDTGGYNIKVAMMDLMKFDCGGGAAVMGAAKAIAELKPEGLEVHFIVAACENMINDKAYVPSDVLVASNGKTIEVNNTDAEGRLTLADALVYADKVAGATSIVELSTLTGACMISLGKQICGIWTSKDDLAQELEKASKASNDKAWRMPLAKEYESQLESTIADLKNCGDRYGGAITAALFLNHFVDEKKRYAHVDIAGPVWNDKTGATGFGAKLLSEWILSQSK